MATRVQVYLESGKRRTFAGALDWPGWCRSGRSEDEALAALFACGPRYAGILAGTRLGFTAPKEPRQLAVVERLKGDATTDFGAPSQAPSVDRDRGCSAAELRRFAAILGAGWRAFDGAVEAARGRRLAKGPRGGGRSLAGIVAHVVEAEANYLAAVGWPAPRAGAPAARLAAGRQAVLAALAASAAGEIAPRGPRGGRRWTARYFVRRVAWHVMAHVWEIERRVAR